MKLFQPGLIFNNKNEAASTLTVRQATEAKIQPPKQNRCSNLKIKYGKANVATLNHSNVTSKQSCEKEALNNGLHQPGPIVSEFKQGDTRHPPPFLPFVTKER